MMSDRQDVAAQVGELTALAVGLFERGGLEEAENLLSSLSAIAPDDFTTAKYLGLIAATRGEDAEAIARLDVALALQPGDAVACNVLSVCHFRRGDASRALDLADRAIALARTYPEAYNSRGNALNSLGRHAEALAAFRTALALRPNDPVAMVNIANALLALERGAHALEMVDRALSIDRTIADAHYNRGNVLQHLGRHAEASRSYEEALALAPDNAVYHLNRGYCRLLMGHLMQGWRELEWRWRKPGAATPPRNLPMPLWLGQDDLDGKSILLHCEQGLGDCIQFVRYAPALARRGAQVVIEAYHPLADLFRTVEGVQAVVPRGSPPPVTDFHCPLMSLPLALQEASISVSMPYLFPPEDLVESWREKLGGRDGTRIGIVAGGNVNHKNDHNRSIALARLMPHLPSGPRYVLLQKELRPGDREVLTAQDDLMFVGDAIGDFTDTAAICMAMDLVVSVDTSVAHLAGALGRPTWILLPFDPDWRWFLEIEESPWYPSVRLYRQASRADWTGVLERVAEDLQALIGEPPPL